MVGLVTPHVPAGYPSDWIALKLLEGDEEITDMMRAALPEEVRIQVDALLRQHEDALIAVASGRYEWIRRMTPPPKAPRATHGPLTLRLDRVATHPLAGW